MSEQVLKNAMLPFYSTKERGSGLGLALCREIVEAHGGSIWFESVVDKGTTFFVDLPIHTEAEASQLTSALVLSPGSVLAQA